jgi:ribA/ribD-fused uncharacterized protein
MTIDHHIEPIAVTAPQPQAASARSRAHLAALIRAGAQPHWLMFWGHRPHRTGTVDASCLSQWYPAPLRIGATLYPTAEHFMMASKARLFGDDAALARIMAAATPNQAKAAGRTIRGFDEATWSAARFGLVVAGNMNKFAQHPPLAQFLCSTAGRVLVEASPYDRIWGTGLPADHPDAPHPDRWPGANLLGFALMRVRDQLAGGPLSWT